MRTELTEKNRRVLVVDDNQAIHADFRKLLVATVDNTDLAQAETDLFGSSTTTDARPGF